jgi:hypothetical protein
VTIFLAIFELANVNASITPFFFAFSLNHTLSQITSVCLVLVWKIINTGSMENSSLKITFEVGAIRPFKSALALLLAIYKVTNIRVSFVFPAFSTPAMLLVLNPVALVLVAILIGKGAKTISPIIFPRALVTFACIVNHSPKSFTNSLFPVAFVNASI